MVCDQNIVRLEQDDRIGRRSMAEEAAVITPTEYVT